MLPLFILGVAVCTHLPAMNTIMREDLTDDNASGNSVSGGYAAIVYRVWKAWRSARRCCGYEGFARAPVAVEQFHYTLYHDGGDHYRVALMFMPQSQKTATI